METATQTLHRLTSYEPGREWDEAPDDPRVVQDLVTNDMDRLPWFWKRYDDSLPRIALPRDLPRTTAPAIGVLAGTAGVPRAEIDLAQLARLLYLSAGVVRTTKRDWGVFYFRAAGSAGGRFPLELYVTVPDGTALPAGVHWYDPHDHALVQVGPPPQGGSPAIAVTGIPWRTGWRYRERGYRHIYWDAGTMLSQLLATADSAGLAPALYTRFPDAAVSDLVGADRVHEWPVAVVALGEDAPALEGSGPAAAGQVDAAPLEFPLATEAQRAGEGDDLGAPWDRGDAVDVSATQSDPLDDVIRRRSSQRRMAPTRALAEDVLRTSLAVALRGIDVPHRVIVHQVDGVAPGVYRWPDLDEPARAGDLRDETFVVALKQGLAKDAAFVVVATTDVVALGDREYREANLAAGLVEGRLHLAAYALGASASGMTFIDSEVPALLGEQIDALLFTCVGVPEYASRAGGAPGAPTEIRSVTPRFED